MSSAKAILITGATGKQGGSVLKQLATHPSSPQFTLLAVTRNTNSPAAQRLKGRHPSALLVQGDLNDVPALFKSALAALEQANKPPQIWGVYSMQVSMGPDVTLESEIAQGNALIDEALAHGVRHFVYSSVDRGGNEKSPENPTPIPHFQSKHRIEQHLRARAGASGETMGWTILRPVAFMDNIEPGFQSKVFLAALRDTLQDKPMQWVSVEDIGLFAARAFRDPGEWNARAEGIAGDELTFEEMSGCFERVTGAPAPATYWVLGTALKWAVGEVGVMLNWFRTDGYGVDVERLRGMERELCGFERWLKERSGWRKGGLSLLMG
ncbi:NAD(P)-binding protein [Trematosphaeria pertusa]|uniref:NAD(P)-binding protein n=1 Tax=Trematosphaeria pertusa TaxID=390896 RepID=A0A6A6HW07_9PLEO|nr:NAD(P)-binding protein [Trematosphaeria pertusa]KAF2242365.1 NAD(P)-binding protein [Trematosphaeria pertusa]